MRKAVILDLDGTLLDTLEDLTDGVNHVMDKYGWLERSIDEVRSFVGNGIGRLMELSIPDGRDNPRFEEAFDDFREYYTSHCRLKTRPYEGIPELLRALSDAGIHIGVVSNKNDAAVRELTDFYFPGLIEISVGARPGIARKPAPDTVIETMRLLDVPREEAVYVGDSEVDVATAKAAHIPCISVCWGFRTRELLEELNPMCVLSSAEELLEYLKRNFI